MNILGNPLIHGLATRSLPRHQGWVPVQNQSENLVGSHEEYQLGIKYPALRKKLLADPPHRKPEFMEAFHHCGFCGFSCVDMILRSRNEETQKLPLQEAWSPR